jgi:hypothetical protein
MIISKYSVQYNEFILLVGEEKYKNALVAIDQNLFEKEKKLKVSTDNVKKDNDETSASLLAVEQDNNTASATRPTTPYSIDGGRPKTKRQYKRKNKTKKQIKQVYRKKTLVGRIG